MPLLRPSGNALRASRYLIHNSTSATSSTPCGIAMPSKTSLTPTTAAAPFSTASRARAADHPAEHDDAHGEEHHYDPPSGWLWGVKPGEKYQKEGWEGIWVWGFYGSLALGVVAYAFKPDTSYVLFLS